VRWQYYPKHGALEQVAQKEQQMLQQWFSCSGHALT
jgi:hypothetical protein